MDMYFKKSVEINRGWVYFKPQMYT
jgi:hypothetical protein